MTAKVRPAATLILCRDRLSGQASALGPSIGTDGSDRSDKSTERDGIEVLLVQRTYKAVFMPGVYVFPGGAVDPGDAAEDLHPHFSGLAPADANGLLAVDEGGVGYLAAAIRECFEEAGLVLGHPGDAAALINGCPYQP